MRARRTRTQTKLTVEQKARNVASAFQVSFRHSRLGALRHSRLDRESPQDALAHARHILLVDDTFTTGATLYACYTALRPYTSARISIATLAAVEGTPGNKEEVPIALPDDAETPPESKNEVPGNEHNGH